MERHHDDPAFVWDSKPAGKKPPKSGGRSARESKEERITLREAERRFDVTASTLRNWARKGAIDAVMDQDALGRRWMVTPDSVADRLARGPGPARRSGTGTAEDGAMLVPRDAWDRMMEQLGNLHEAGMRLAEARERAAKAETEASFLRERLAELRAERDELRGGESKDRSRGILARTLGRLRRG